MGIRVVKDALEAIRKGKVVIVRDDEDRENEGDLTIAAEKVTPETINFMAKYGRGLICLALTGERVDQLHLPQMVERNTSKYGTAFTVSIEARDGVTTGISAADRATTILTAINPKTGPSDLVAPGHVFPLRARAGGVLERAGQTEASVDLARLAGLYPAGVICEIMNEDGAMARGPQLEAMARSHALVMVTVADIIAFRLRTETFVHRVAESDFPTSFGQFRAVVFENSLDKENHLALIKGTIDPEKPTLVRVQEQSTLGDVFHCLRGEGCGTLNLALKMIEGEGKGVFVYLRQEGRGKLLADEIRSYAQQDAGKDTTGIDLISAPVADMRSYGIGAQILQQLSVRKIRLLTNHPKKIVGLQGFGITVIGQVPLETSPAGSSLGHPRTKQGKPSARR